MSGPQRERLVGRLVGDAELRAHGEDAIGEQLAQACLPPAMDDGASNDVQVRAG